MLRSPLSCYWTVFTVQSQDDLRNSIQAIEVAYIIIDKKAAFGRCGKNSAREVPFTPATFEDSAKKRQVSRLAEGCIKPTGRGQGQYLVSERKQPSKAANNKEEKKQFYLILFLPIPVCFVLLKRTVMITQPMINDTIVHSLFLGLTTPPWLSPQRLSHLPLDSILRCSGAPWK
ncbi:hypothetical protein AVEN_86153-1 [Araneus ventricosus]|uniref:Uncharacterized protein n=1 Tax=Araneus ventricosus TaxID=182803 RepID=A0A4Y2DVX9_ARAVE|nr:hypothetical protein AVEN_86153-1 [Araneus ventricosus]